MTDIDPFRSNRIVRAEKAHRQHAVTHNSSSIEPGQTLQVILKGKKDEARSIVPNIGHKIIKAFKIYFEGNEVLSINNYDEIMTYKYLWLAKKDKNRWVFQGIKEAVGLSR